MARKKARRHRNSPQKQAQQNPAAQAARNMIAAAQVMTTLGLALMIAQSPPGTLAEVVKLDPPQMVRAAINRAVEHLEIARALKETRQASNGRPTGDTPPASGQKPAYGDPGPENHTPPNQGENEGLGASQQ